jgi:hypothetical protein
MVTGAGVGRGAFSVCFFGVAEAVGLARGVGAWASARVSAAIERRVRSESTFCISCYFAETGAPTEGCKHPIAFWILRYLRLTSRGGTRRNPVPRHRSGHCCPWQTRIKKPSTRTSSSTSTIGERQGARRVEANRSRIYFFEPGNYPWLSYRSEEVGIAPPKRDSNLAIVPQSYSYSNSSSYSVPCLIFS